MSINDNEGNVQKEVLQIKQDQFKSKKLYYACTFIVFLLILFYVLVFVGKNEEFREKTLESDGIGIKVFALHIGPGNTCKMIDMKFNDPIYGANQVIYANKGYDTKYKIGGEINIDTPGFIWAENIDMNVVKNYIEKQGIDSYSIKTKLDNHIERDDEGKNIYCCMKSISDLVEIVLSKPVDCDVVITNKTLNTRLPVINYHPDASSDYRDLNKDHLYNFYINPSDPKLKKYSFNKHYRGVQPTKHVTLMIHEDFLKQWDNPLNKSDRKLLKNRILKRLERNHPDYEILKKSLSAFD